MPKFTDKDYERAAAEAAESVERMVAVNLSAAEWKFNLRYGASFSAGDDCSGLFYTGASFPADDGQLRRLFSTTALTS